MKYKALHASVHGHLSLFYRFNSNLPHSFLTQKLNSRISGVLWAIGNDGALVMMKLENLGTGQGFAVAQLCMVVNALLSIYSKRLHHAEDQQI